MATFGRTVCWPKSENLACGRAAAKNADASKGKLQAFRPVQNQRPVLREQNQRSGKHVPTQNKDTTAKTLSDRKEKSPSRLKENDGNDCPETELEAFSTSHLPTGVPDIDFEDGKDPVLCAEYAKDIYNYMFSLERKWPIRARFLSSQLTVTPSIRANVVDWLIEVHSFYDLLPETLFRSVSLLDRYLQSQAVDKSNMQLLAVSALLVASKFEDATPVLVGDVVDVSASNCKKGDVLAMEKQILFAVDWHLERPLPLDFITRNYKAAEASAIEKNTALYILELSLTNYVIASVAPSKQAAAALYFALLLHGRPESCWDEKMAYYSGHTEQSLRLIVRRMAQLMLDAPDKMQTAAYKKFRNTKYDKVAILSATRVEKLRKMAGRVG